MRIYDDSNIPIEVTPGQAFAISLGSIPPTGYTWQPEYDPTIIDFLSPQEFAPHTSAVGSGGEEIFEFQAKQAGDTEITMKYQREWETTPRKIKIFKVQIIP